MRYTHLFRRNRFSTFGIAALIIFAFIEPLYRLTKYVIIKLYRFVRWLINYYHFRHVDLSYNQIKLLIKQMTPRQFEVFLSELFRVNGYETELTPESCDGGKDVILWDDNGDKIYLEAKHYISDNLQIGREIVQKLAGACLIDGVKKAIIVTTGVFHNNAWECLNKLEDKDFELAFFDFDDIMHLVKETKVELLPMIMATVFEETPTFQIIKGAN